MSKQVIKWNLNNILALCRNNKCNRDKLDYELAVTISSNKLKNLQNNKNLKEDLRRKILAGQNIPTCDPLNLQKSNTPLETGLLSICRKSPSFFPVPPSYNWLQLQKILIVFEIAYAHVIYLEIRVVTILQMLRDHQQKTP